MQRALTAILVIALVGAAVYFAFQLAGGGTPGKGGPTKPPVEAPVPAPESKSAAAQTQPIPVISPVGVAAAVPPDVLEGTIRDEFNQPVAEVSVQIVHWEFIRDSNRPADRSWKEDVLDYTVSDNDGKYQFKKQRPNDKITIRASKPGFISSIKDNVPVGRAVDFVLLAGTPVSGTVVDAATDKPVAGVSIKGWYQVGENSTDYNRSFRWKEEVTTDAKGEFHFEGVPAKLVKFMLYHPEYDDVAEDQTILAGAKNVLHFKVRLGLVIEGQVKDALSGAPLAGITVKAQDTLVPRWHATTDAKGRFRLTGVKSAPVRFNFSGKGYTALTEMKTLTGDDRFDSTKDGPRIEFKLNPAGRAVGQILTTQGAPVANAKVCVAENRTLFYPVRDKAEAVTDQDGKFLVQELGAGSKYRVAAWADGTAPGVSEEFSVGPAEIKEGLIVRIPAGAVIKGTLIDEVHAPVANAVVDIDIPAFREVWFPPGSDAGQPTHRNVTTGPDGTYKFDLLWPGQYSLRVDQPEYVLIDKVTLNVKEVEEEIIHDFTMQRAYSITGHVRGVDGRPAEGSTVSAWWFERNDQPVTATTDKNGEYRLLRLNKGPYRVKAEKSDAGLTSLAREGVESGTNNVDFDLVPRGMVVGTVVSPSGSPVSDFSVLLRPVARATPGGKGARKGQGAVPVGASSAEDEVHDPGGLFRVQNVDPGTYSLEVIATDYAPSTPMEVRVDGGKTTDAGVITVRAGAGVSGVVKGPAGEPVPDVSIKVQYLGGEPAGGRSLWAARTASDGTYRVVGLPSGDYLLQFESTQYVDPQGIRITLADGQSLEHNEILRPAASVTFMVKDDLNEPVPSVFPTVSDSQGRKVAINPNRPGGGSTDSQGRLELQKVPAGESITIRLVRAGYEVTEVNLELRMGERVTREVRIVKVRGQ